MDHFSLKPGSYPELGPARTPRVLLKGEPWFALPSKFSSFENFDGGGGHDVEAQWLNAIP